MLNTLFTWWKEQMRDLLPASIRPAGRSWRKGLVVKADTAAAADVELSLQRHSGQTFLGRHTLGSGLQHALDRLSKTLRRTAVLQVPAGWLLERQVILPLAAELDLGGVMAHEMDRLTPFRATDVLWDHVIERRDTKRGQIHVRITIVSRLQVQPILDALRQAGLVPARIQAAGAGQQRSILIAKGNPKRAWPGPRALAWAQGGCGALAATAVALPFIFQTLAQNDIESRIAAMRPNVAEAEKLRKVIAGGATTADLITGARNQVGNPLQSIGLLTEMLPDDTYLTLLTIRQRKLSVSGRSAGAAKLIGALAANPLLQNPAFAAPVLRDETNGGETFSIRVEVGS